MIRRSFVLLLAMAGALEAPAQTSIRTTKHNLSASGPGRVRAVSETEVCIFCHTPHSSRSLAPLWNRNDPGGTYVMYGSATMDSYPLADAPQPNGESKLCLSCHDGTLALGETAASGSIRMSGGVTTAPMGPANFGRDLSGHHPISISMTGSLTAAKSAGGKLPLKTVARIRSSTIVKLDSADRVQCTSCHDPHKDPFGKFLRTTSVDEICLSCHT